MSIKHTLLGLIMASTTCALPVFAQQPTDVGTEPSLTAQQARNIAAAAERAAIAHGYAIVVSIIDNHGNLLHFHRMDGTSSGSIQVAQLKAATSARFPLSSRSLGERSAALPANPYASLPGFTLLEGGLPIMSKDGTHLGGIGISGATPELDAQFAQAALDGV